MKPVETEAAYQAQHGFPWYKVKHIKTGHIYTVQAEIINATNAQSGQVMVLYERNGVQYVRAKREFNKKFGVKND